MPERPDLDYLIPILNEQLAGRRILAAELLNPVVLRLALEGTLQDHLGGVLIQGVERRAHFAWLHLDAPVELIVSPMLAGRFTLQAPGKRRRKDTALALSLDDRAGNAELELLYRDDVQMGKVYLIPQGRVELVPGFATVGVDVLSDEFTVELLAKLAKKRRDQVKLFLMDKSALDAMGNAYADEVLHAAGIHPKLRGNKLDEEQIARLHEAIVSVLGEASAEIQRRQPPIDEKVRDFLKVRNRKGEPCPSCGTTIRAAGVRGHDAFFCPSCQPDIAGKGFVDWRKLRK